MSDAKIANEVASYQSPVFSQSLVKSIMRRWWRSENGGGDGGIWSTESRVLNAESKAKSAANAA